MPVGSNLHADPHACAKCGSNKPHKNGKYQHIVYDLQFFSTGIRRWVVKYDFTRYQCWMCKSAHFSISRRDRYGQNLKAYMMYQVIELRIPQRAVARSLNSLFGFHLPVQVVNRIKTYSSRYYERSYYGLLDKIVGGMVVHADETRVPVGGKTHYVWVFTSHEEVAYVYSETRDADTAQKTLSNFKGVLVSDFYSGYDGIKCAQQKCLIHLLRDINEDLLKQPFNEEMAGIARGFASLLGPMVETVDRFGLKSRYLKKHKTSVGKFYRWLSRQSYSTDVAIAYKKRFEKNCDKLFTFLDYDGIPWNNNNAEHAIKAFARMRRIIGANGTEKGIREYLVLLSLSETCQYKGIDFLSFLRSGERDINNFIDNSK